MDAANHSKSGAARTQDPHNTCRPQHVEHVVSVIGPVSLPVAPLISKSTSICDALGHKIEII